MTLGNILTALMGAAVFERFPRFWVVFGESGIGWLPYLIDRMDNEYLIDNTRLVSELGVQYRPYRERVLQIINDIRKEEGFPKLTAQ